MDFPQALDSSSFSLAQTLVCLVDEIDCDLNAKLQDTPILKTLFFLNVSKGHAINLESVNVAYPEKQNFLEVIVLGYLLAKVFEF